MDSSKATPLPWTVTGGGSNGNQVTIPIRTPRGQMILSANGLPKRDEMRANAELIVTAVNQHQVLIDLVRDMLVHFSCICGTEVCDGIEARARKAIEAGGE